MKKNRTARALLLSALSLLLCVSMLVGSTFAWFTDSVVSANNIIKSGNLDIELEYWKDGQWMDVKGASDILTNQLWEPGVTEVAYLRIANAGTLALKYQLGININSEIPGVNVDDEIFKLSDYIQFGIKAISADAQKKPATFEKRQDAVAALESSKKISAGYAQPGSMEPQQEQYLALVVYMPESVDNKANYKTGTNAPVINLGINVYATQFTSEEDSFDKFYDEEAPWAGMANTEWYNTTDTTFTLTKAEELAGLAQIVNSGTDNFKDKTIQLGADIDLNNMLWTPIGSGERMATKFVGSFYGNGYTISNLKAIGDEYVGLFGCTYVGAHLEGIKIVNAYVSGDDYVGAVLGGGYLAKNCIKNCYVENATVIASPYLKGDKYDGGAKAGVIVGVAYNGNVIGNTAKNSTVMAYRDLGGIAGMMMVDGGFTIEASNNTVENVTLSYVGVAGAYDGNKTNGTMGEIVGRVGTNASLGEGNTATNVGKQEENKDATTIFTYEELVAFAAAVNAGNSYAGKTVVLGADIDLMNNEFTPIGTNANPFKGTFDGKGHTISNLKVTLDVESTQRAALFGQANNATIKNVNVENVNLRALARVAAIVGGATSTTVENCHVTGDIKLQGYQYVGAIVGYGYVTVKNCSVAGTADNYATYTAPAASGYGKMYMGGLVGWMGEGNSSITNSTAKYVKMTTNSNVGAITGLSHYGNTVANCTAENVTITANSAEFRPGTVGLIAGGCAGTETSPSYFNACVAKNVVATDGGVAVEALYGKAPSSKPGAVVEAYAIVDGGVSVTSAEALEAALAAAGADTTIVFGGNISGDVTINQNVNNKLTIDGNGYKFDGTMTIKAQSETSGSGFLTIKDVNFKTADDRTFIVSSETNHYPYNVTVSGCTFEGTGATGNVVGITVKGAMNMVIEDCTATNVHSILQNTAGWNLTVKNVTVTASGRGMALGTVQGVSLQEVKVEAAKYGVRMDTGYNNNAVITDCDITAFIPVVVRKVSVASNVTFNGANTMTATNTDGIWCAIGASEYETNGVMPTAAAKTVTVTVNDAGLNTAGIYNNSGK